MQRFGPGAVLARAAESMGFPGDSDSGIDSNSDSGMDSVSGSGIDSDLIWVKAIA